MSAPAPDVPEAMVALALRHAELEAADDLRPVLDTLEDDCVYELQPVGRYLSGLDQARRYYEHFFSGFRPLVTGYALRGQWTAPDGVGQEYTIWTRAGAGGSPERHDVIGILTFGTTKLSGERLYASERLLRLMVGPVYDEARRLPGSSSP